MNIFNSLTLTTNETASMKEASLSFDTENLEFAFLMGQSMQTQGSEFIPALPIQENINFFVEGVNNAVQVFAGNNERIFAGMENDDLPAGNVRSNKFTQLTADTEIMLFPTESKEMPLVNFNQEKDLEIAENLLASKSGDKKQVVTINVDDSVKLHSPNAALNRTQSELLPGLPDVDSRKDPHRQLTAYLKNLNAIEVLINDKPQPEKTVTESVVPLLESDQMESSVRSNIRRASGGNGKVESISKESDKVSREIVLPVGEESLTDSDLMKKQPVSEESLTDSDLMKKQPVSEESLTDSDMIKKPNELLIEKEANAKKDLEQKSESTKFDSLFKTGKVESIEAGNSVRTNLSTLQPLTQFRTSTDGHVTETVKIVLPENFKLNTNQKTQSIIIRIEPDHLGPARLELKMTDDFLSAKLIVETVEAKIFLESSISQLKEKLASADIKVENLEINVRSESSNSHMSDKQQAHWQDQKALRQFNRLDESLISNEAAEMDAPLNLRQQYAGAGGVNLLA